MTGGAGHRLWGESDMGPLVTGCGGRVTWGRWSQVVGGE